MTKQTFYRKLRRYAGLFKWKLDNCGRIRASEKDMLFCPITAIYYVEKNKYVSICSTTTASNKMGFDEFRHDIVVTADNHPILTKSQKIIRKTLLKALNLEEE